MTTTNQLTFQAGKFYKTRDGRKARIYATDGQEPYCTHGALLEHDGSWYTASWTQTGSYFMMDTPNDLIAEWKDAPEVDWPSMPEGANHVYLGGDLQWRGSERKPTKDTYGWSNPIGKVWFIYPQHTPNWTGDWRESLVQRPEARA